MTQNIVTRLLHDRVEVNYEIYTGSHHHSDSVGHLASNRVLAGEK